MLLDMGWYIIRVLPYKKNPRVASHGYGELLGENKENKKEKGDEVTA